ncbi:hypothetical protein [Brumimicrobium mesophilum]|uniref:hypothetical protein n=1 Tax=Brumimicrobium mesophilum TaxID=392717 RepID=UPI000D13FE16|nr:hypothetical protein [Brumimicrobium mesophilum]
MTRARTYEEEANKLAKAIDIAIEAFQNECPSNFTPQHQDHLINTYIGWKESCLNPENKFRKLAALKYIINDLFTYFQEGSGPTVEFFWRKINEMGLDYQRENRLKKILERGKIKGRTEFEYVVDMFVVAQQNGMITTSEAQRLSDMLEKFELKG